MENALVSVFEWSRSIWQFDMPSLSLHVQGNNRTHALFLSYQLSLL